MIMIQIKVKMRGKKSFRKIYSGNTYIDCITINKIRGIQMFRNALYRDKDEEKASQLVYTFLESETFRGRFMTAIEEFLCRIHHIQFTMKSQLIFNKTRLHYLKHIYAKELDEYRTELEE